jgi:hypothetical protein
MRSPNGSFRETTLTETVPARHPDQPRPVPAVVRLYARALLVAKPTGEQWRQLGVSLTVGDKPMDDLVEWMRTSRTAQARQLFEQASNAGIAAVPDPPAPLRDFFTQVEATPDWVDWNQIRRGQRALRAAGADGIYLARDVSLLGGYQFSGFNQTLLRTGALEKGSNQRFAETFQWAMDVIAEDGLAAQGVGYQSTLRVRLIHAYIRSHVAAMADWRGDDWGVPVNQTDMAATLLGALIAPTAGALGMGLIYTPSDLDAIAHVARYVGWLIGVQEQWLPLSFRDGVRGLYHTLAALSQPDETTPLLAVPMIADPMTWNYTTLPGLRRRLARAQHLSITSAYLGPSAMRALGLPAYTPPWYPLVRIPLNATRSITALLLPGGRARAAQRGWRQQQALMRTITTSRPTIGNSATHVTHAA